MPNVKYTRDHEWIRVEQNSGDVPYIGLVGITNYAQEQLGDIVFVELPELGTVMTRGDEVAVIESVKAASELYSPVSGEVIEINVKLSEQPELINNDPFGQGWFLKVQLSDLKELDELMDEAAYHAHIADSD